MRGGSVSGALLRWGVHALCLLLPLAAVGTRPAEDFYTSARTGDVDAMMSMLSAGVITVHQRDSKGNTAFIIASGRGQTAVLQFLLSKGANLEDTTRGGLLGGKTALSWACSQGRAAAVRFLIDSGADINHPTEDGVFLGKTPLMWASSQGRTNVVEILIAAGAEINVAMEGGNFRGKTSLMWASSQGRVEAVHRLLEAGAEVDLVDGDGVSALMWATGSEGENQENDNKGLFEKALKGHNDVVRALLLYGASLDKTDKDGITALMYACFHGHADAVVTLANAGADASMKNTAGKTAMLLAMSNNHLGVISVLRKGPTIMEIPTKELLETSVCGWLLSLLRRTEGLQFAHIRASDFNIANSCKPLKQLGLQGPMSRLLEILEVTTISDLIENLKIVSYGARALAKRELTILSKRLAIEGVFGDHPLECVAH